MIVYVIWLTGLLNEYLAEGDAESLDADVAGVIDAASQDEDLATDANDDRSANVLQNCFATILDTLASNNQRCDGHHQLVVGSREWTFARAF